MLLRLKDPATRARIKAELLAPPQISDRFMRAAGGPAGVIVLPFADSLSRFNGKRLSEIAALQHRDPIETLFDLVTEERARTGAIYFVMSEADVDTALATWWTSFDTDYGGVAPDGPFGHDGVHPRTYGTFAKILGRYVRELHLLPLESAVRKMTSLPAQRVGLLDRGLLRPGMYADITVFDPDSIADRATFDAPHQPSVGVTYVFVNGQMVLDHGQVSRGPSGTRPPRTGVPAPRREMTLGRLLLAWLPVAVWFAGATGVARRLTLPEGTFPSLGVYLYRAVGRAFAEALVLTLLASLWFDTLGAGVWWLPVSLVGALVAIAGVTPVLPSVSYSRRTVILLFLMDVVRYVGAGALLVWRLR